MASEEKPSFKSDVDPKSGENQSVSVGEVTQLLTTQKDNLARRGSEFNLSLTSNSEHKRVFDRRKSRLNESYLNGEWSTTLHWCTKCQRCVVYEYFITTTLEVRKLES